jgi:nucleoside phosphorylase
MSIYWTNQVPGAKVDAVVGREPEIDGSLREVLQILVSSTAPVSGRRVAQVLHISPTTASNRLKALLDRGLVQARPSGAAVLWSANEASPVVRTLRQDLDPGTRPVSGPAPVPADILAWALPAPGIKPVLKVAVLTALAPEYAAVRVHLSGVTQSRTRSGTRYDVGFVRGQHLDWEVYLAEVGMGNAGAAAEVAGAVETFSPRLILFVGVAGGLKPSDQHHGDVVVASMVYNVHSAKIVPGPDGGSDIQSRPLGVPASHRLTQLVRAVDRTPWAADLAFTGQPPGTLQAQPAVHLRPIVAGEVVLADPDGEMRKFIAGHFNDAAAIDMESLGVYETAHRYELPVLAVRGLSDLLGDKDPAADRERQPRAAANAAAFAIALLSHADEQDFPPLGPGGLTGGGIPSTSPLTPGLRAVDTPPAEESLARLAPVLRIWWRRLRVSHGAAADAAVAELAGRSSSPASWLGRLRHRPPAWLRDDGHADAWALAACFADSHGSAHATWLYDQAAHQADRAGEDVIASLHRVQAALTAARYGALSLAGGHDGANGAEDPARAEVLSRLSDLSLLTLGPVTDVVRGAATEDPAAILAAAPAALQVLGLPALAGAGRGAASPGLADAATGAAAAVFAELAETDPDIVDQIRADVLLMNGYALLGRSEPDPALTAFTRAREFAPATAAPLIAMARARLHRVDGPAGAAEATIDVSSELAEAEELVLLARDRRRAWNVDSAEAVAIAVRARLGRDPDGALRLALPAPRGAATDAEASSPRVREAAALAALFAGEYQLALELASSITDPVERDLLRAMTLTQLPNTADQVEEALRQALAAAPASRPDQLVRALMGLVRLGAPILPGQPGTIAPQLARLRGTDPEAADLVEASAALRSGQLQQALVLTRQYPTYVPAVEIAAEAAAMAGDPAEAFRILDRAGRDRGEESLRVQAMVLAADAGLDEQAQQAAAQLVLSRDAETRRRALEVQLTLAGRGGRWDEVADLGRRLLDDDTLDLSDVRRSRHVIEYRWAVAGAEFNLRRPNRARQALDEPDMLQPRNPMEASLLLATLGAAAAPPAQDGTLPTAPALTRPMIERALAAAAAFPDNEEVVASTLKLVMIGAGSEPLPDALLTQVRALQEEFFTRFPDSTHLRRIPVGEDLSDLIEHLRATFAPGAEQIVDIARKVWLGLYPQGLLAQVTGRSYAETLIKRTTGCLVAAAADPALAVTEQAAARAAREAGTVVIDTSTLVLLDHLGGQAPRLTAQFARVLFPASYRDDVLQTRNSLALRSSSTLGWNLQQQRPQLTDIAPDIVNGWAESGDRLAQRLARTDIIPGPRQEWSWDGSLQAASQEQAALWADDLALRHAARSLGVPAFGTLDLVADLVHASHILPPVLEEVTAAFRRAYAVDLPDPGPLLDLAATEGWKPDGYAALLLSRPRQWSQPADGFTQYMQLIRAIPPATATPECVTGWAAAALTGLAWAIPPASRPLALAGLVAWTVMNAGAEHVFPQILDAGENVMAAAAPAGDLLAQTVAVLTETLSRIAAPDKVGVLFTRLIANFSPERRTQAMQSFLSMPR